MGTKDVLAFQKRLLTDEDFQRRAVAAAEGKQGAEATAALLQLGAGHGMELTADELNAVRGAMAPSGELSATDLEGVTGGALANIDLQNQLQKQQQTLQTMSNVSKMLHDTAMAVIRKIG
jgi:hypothetical protein